MTGLEIRCNVVARCIELRDEKEMSVSKRMLGKKADNEEKTGRIEASWATITYRKLDLYWGRLSALF